MPETVLAFDFGERRVGVAVGQALTGTASPLRTISYAGKAELTDAVAELVREWDPGALVVGIPTTEAGEEQPVTRAARRFARRLAQRFGLPVHETDERFTSRAAAARFRELRQAGAARRGAVAQLDAVAAQLILEQWFAEQPTATC